MSPPELVVFDFDGTLAEQRGSWGLLYRLFGTEEAGRTRTDAYWDGEITFAEWCRGNVADLRERGVTRIHIERAANAIKLTNGVPEVLSELNDAAIPFGVLSSGISNLMRPLDPYDPAFVVSNTIIFDDDGVPADVNAVVGPDRKGERLNELCTERGFDPESIWYIGDSHSDTEAFEVAGRAVLFDPDDRITDADYELVDEIFHSRDMVKVYYDLFETIGSSGGK